MASVNSIAFNERLTSELDKMVVQKSKTGFFVDNNLKAKFVGAKTIMLPEIDLTGLGDYDRNSGFISGTVKVTNTPYTMKMDRARSFQIDSQDADESGVANLAGQIGGEFVRTQVVPEIDAYVLSKLAGLAATQQAPQVVNLVEGKTLIESSFKMLDEALRNAEAASGGDEEMVAFVNQEFWAALSNSPDFNRFITVSDFSKGGVNTRVKSFNGCAILPVPDKRMKSAYTFHVGTEGTPAQGDSDAVYATGGFEPQAGAKDIYLIVMPKNGASLVKKTEQTRIFTPKQNQQADAWKIDYRIYYDVFVKKSRLGSIWAAIAK